MHTLLGVVVTTFNRPEYLSEFIQSLAHQDFAEPYDLVILDNGSSTPVQESVLAPLSATSARPVLLREEANALSWERFTRAASATKAEYILVPGDDDILKPDFLGKMSTLARSEPKPMMVSAAAETIDGEGRSLGGRLTPRDFPNQQVALASIISQATYAMPASGFHRSILTVANPPRTRSSVDWWLWLQCWLRGPAAVTEDVLVQYRIHVGQEQHQYGVDGKALDGARMLLEFVTSEGFKSVVASWTPRQHEKFIQTILEGRGPSWGEPRWSGIIQTVLADTVAPYAPKRAVLNLFADASARVGVISPPGALNAMAQEPTESSLLPSTWKHLKISLQKSSPCSALEAWSSYLAIPANPRGSQIQVELHCACGGHRNGAHEVSVRISHDQETKDLALAPIPTEATAAPLLDLLGRQIGRPAGMGQPVGVEEQAIRLIRRLRRSRTANALVTLGRRLGLRIG